MMERTSFDDMLVLVAAAYDTTPEIIRERISQAIAQGQQSTDPQIRNLWKSLPHEGTDLPLCDYVAYLAQTLQKPFEP